MAGSDNELGGAAITAQELYDHISVLAGLSYDNAERAAVLHDQAQRTFAGAASAHKQTLQWQEALSKQLKEQYAPEGVAAAAEAALAAASDFESRVRDATDSVLTSLRAAATKLWMQIVCTALVGMATAGVTVSIVLRWVPSLDEVKSRRAEVAELDAQLKVMRGVVVLDGKKWVPILDQGRMCTPAGSENCKAVGRIQ